MPIEGLSNDLISQAQKAVRRNTLSQVADARQSGNPVDRQQIQASNQEIRDQARETGIALYSQNLQKQAFETYVNASSNANEFYNSSTNDNSSATVNTFDPQAVNEAVRTVQKRVTGIALYENLSNNQPQRPGAGGERQVPLDVLV